MFRGKCRSQRPLTPRLGLATKSSTGRASSRRTSVVPAALNFKAIIAYSGCRRALRASPPSTSELDLEAPWIDESEDEGRAPRSALNTRESRQLDSPGE